MRFKDDIMTTQDVARYIKMNERTVLKLAQEGKIPAMKVASQWRFKRSLIDEWLDMEMRNFPREQLEEIGAGGPIADIAHLVNPLLIIPELTATTKEGVLEELVGQLDELGYPIYLDRILSAVQQREKTFSTGMPGGVALPHPRNVKEMRLTQSHLVVGRSSVGIDFGALDGQPTYLFFLLCASGEKTHLKLLAQLAMQLRTPENVEKIRAGVGREGMLEALEEVFGPRAQAARAANQ